LTVAVQSTRWPANRSVSHQPWQVKSRPPGGSDADSEAFQQLAVLKALPGSRWCTSQQEHLPPHRTASAAYLPGNQVAEWAASFGATASSTASSPRGRSPVSVRRKHGGYAHGRSARIGKDILHRCLTSLEDGQADGARASCTDRLAPVADAVRGAPQ